MWNRKELKTKGKASFLANYWKCVLAGIILTIALAGGPKITKVFNAGDVVEEGTVEEIDEAMDEITKDEGLQKLLEEKGIKIEDRVLKEVLGSSWLKPLAGFIAVIAALAATFGLMIKIFLLNPLQVGGRRFFLKNLTEKAEIKEYSWGFSNSYLNMVVTMFFKDLYTILWALLLVVPGIVKAYEYRMVPYILAENSEIDRKEAFARSREMMTGNKWDAFVLDLSFIGWEILNAITIGVVGLFFSNPYQYSAKAALYEALKTEKSEVVAYDNYVEVE